RRLPVRRADRILGARATWRVPQLGRLLRLSNRKFHVYCFPGAAVSASNANDGKRSTGFFRFGSVPGRSHRNAQVLDLEVLVDAVLRTLAADPRLLHAAERRLGGGNETGIDADHPVLQPFRDAP